MKINAQSKISTLIKHNKNAIDVIASINPHFKKLKNPILRKILAPRVTLEDAARIGKCRVEEFFEALAAIGFTIEDHPKPNKGSSIQKNVHIMDAINSGKVKTLDVRSILEAGNDPFNNIMDAIKILPDGYALELINSFEPIPLIKILNQKGYATTVSTHDNVVKTYFLKVAEADEKSSSNDDFIFRVSIEELESEMTKFKERCKEIDVCNLEMPLPMVTILNELEDLQEGYALFVHHKKVPQYLLPELEERKFKTWIAEIQDANVKLLIHK